MYAKHALPFKLRSHAYDDSRRRKAWSRHGDKDINQKEKPTNAWRKRTRKRRRSSRGDCKKNPRDNESLFFVVFFCLYSLQVKHIHTKHTNPEYTTCTPYNPAWNQSHLGLIVLIILLLLLLLKWFRSCAGWPHDITWSVLFLSLLLYLQHVWIQQHWTHGAIVEIETAFRIYNYRPDSSDKRINRRCQFS